MDGPEFKGAQNLVPSDVCTVFDPSSACVRLTNRDSVTPTLDAAAMMMAAVAAAADIIKARD